MSGTEIHLGKLVKVSQKLVRTREWRIGNQSFIKPKRGAKEHKFWASLPLHKPKWVIIIGIRYLRNGYIEYGEEAGMWFETTDSFKAALVVEKLTSKPFYVPLYHITKQE